MVRKEYYADSFYEAIEKIKADGFRVLRDKSTTWRKAGAPITDRAFKVFAAKVLEDENVIGFPGIGFVITIEHSVKDTKGYPYSYEHLKDTKRITKYKCYEWRRKDNDELVKSIGGATRAEALKIGKQLIRELKTDLKLEIVYRIEENDGVVGILHYKPSTKQKLGRYVFFGNEAPDIF